MKRIHLFIYLFIISFISNAQINQYGIPFISNYTPKEYNAGEQNWCIVEDFRGVIYFGNNYILEFDGVNWRKIPVANNSIIRSLNVDHQGRIYVGAVGEFGYLMPSVNGTYQYYSLIEKLDTIELDFSDIWKTYIYDSHVYFCAYNKIFDYSNDSVKVINLGKTNKFSFLIGSSIYNEDFFSGLKKLNNDSLVLIPGGAYYRDKDIFYMEEFDDNQIIIGTIFNGLALYDLNSGFLNTDYFSKKLNSKLSSSYLYHGKQISQNLYSIATLQNGVFYINNRGEIVNHLTPNEGLQDIIVTSTYTNNRTENLSWLSLNSGNSKIEINSSVMQFTDKQGIDGAINDIIRFDDELFISTDLGVYFLEYNKDGYPAFKKVEGLSDQSWSFLKFNNTNKPKLLVATSIGVYEIINHQVKQLIFDEHENNNYYCYKLYQDSVRDDLLFIGHSKGFLTASFSGNSWRKVNLFPEITNEIRQIQRTENGDFWLGTYFSGLIRIKSIYSSDYEVIKYAKESGLTTLNDIILINYRNQIYFATSSGLFNFDTVLSKFNRDTLFGIEYASGQKSVFRCQINPINNKLTVSSNCKNGHAIVIIELDNGKVKIDSLPFKRLPNEQFDAIYHDSNGIIWLGSSSGLYSYNPNVKVDYYKPYHTLVRKVTTVNDSVLFWGTNYTTDSAGNRIVALDQPDKLIPVLYYKYNDLTFEYAAPYYIEEKMTEYSFLLDGYKDAWSKWNTEPKAVFTNLREGKYNFKVKAKNIYGIESETASYQFTILPPWYRTLLAYFVYAIFILIAMIVVVKLYTRKLRLEKIKLEGIVQERTAEIRCQKDAIEQKNEILKEQKEEIEAQADSLKEANIVLQEQKEEITHQKEEITSSIVYAKRIQRAIVPTEEMAETLLKNYFLLWRPRDIVSGDFWWLGEKDGLVIVAAADCTGHGVPGAFMSMLGISFLNEIINQQKETQSHEILNQLRTKVKTTLGQTGKEGEAKDGMDIALMVIDFNQMTLQFSGAYNPLYLVRNGEVEVIKADKNPIGIYIKEKETFTQNIVPVQTGDTLYIFSDGYIDQFGGPHQMKFTSNRFRDLLLTIQDKPMAEQKEILNTAIDEWRAGYEQIDDILVLGIKI